MADDLDKKLKQIADMFGVSDTSGLKNIVQSIVPPGSDSSQGNPASEYNNNSSGNSSNASQSSIGNLPVDLGFLTKANELLSAFNNVKDSRITLLNSVQPFLGVQRQQRLGGAIQLLRIISVISTLNPNQNRNTKG